ncbi:unnamed protein product, partial [Heligmosomoides polygyrus]|uniref:BTB_2 domain-containing protein n=1 Tax=Heligmosomoides polygyrus TaxID=6339 RepID=A0A183F9Z3_HELPZ
CSARSPPHGGEGCFGDRRAAAGGTVQSTLVVSGGTVGVVKSSLPTIDPGGQFHNETDHIIYDRKYCLTDVSVFLKFYRGEKATKFDFYSDLFDSHDHLPSCHLPQDGWVVPSLLSSKIRHAISSLKKRTAPSADRIRPKPEEPPASAHQHPGAALHTLPVGVQCSISVEYEQDRLAVQEGRCA